MGCIPPLAGYRMGGRVTDSIWQGPHWAGRPIDRTRAHNVGYPSGGVPEEFGGYPAGGCILRIEYRPLTAETPRYLRIGPVRVFLWFSRWFRVCILRGVCRFWVYQMGGRPYGFDTPGRPKLEHAKPPTEPTGICVTSGRTGRSG